MNITDLEVAAMFKACAQDEKNANAKSAFAAIEEVHEQSIRHSRAGGNPSETERVRPPAGRQAYRQASRASLRQASLRQARSLVVPAEAGTHLGKDGFPFHGNDA
jgi:hypothetical protein